MSEKKKKKQSTKRPASLKKRETAKKQKPAAKPISAVNARSQGSRSKTGAKKLAIKKTEPKKVAAKKPAESKRSANQTKPVSKKATAELKHSDKDEMIVDTGKPIIVLGKGARKTKLKKELRKVRNQKGGYTALDGRTGKTFATAKEAQDYAIDLFKKTGRVIEVIPTNRQVTHTFLAPKENTKN